MPSTNKILPNETLADSAIRVYGTMAGIFAMALATGISITDEPDVDTQLSCPDIQVNTAKLVLKAKSTTAVIKALPNQTFIDAVSDNYKTLEGLFAAAVDTEIGITDDVAVGDQLNFPPISGSSKIKIVFNRIVPQVVTALSQQTLIDIAMQESGTAEALFQLALLNGVAITDNIVGVSMEKGAILNSRIVAMFKINKPASDTATPLPVAGLPPGGIGYMQIESSFIVS